MMGRNRSIQLAAAGIAVAACALACGRSARSEPPQTVLTYESPMWYEETARYFQVSPDGGLAIYGTGPRSRLYDLTTASDDAARWRGTLQQVRGGAFGPAGAIARIGTLGPDTGWFLDRGGSPSRLDIPPSALPRWTSDGSRLLSFTPGEKTIALSTASKISFDAAVTGASWAPAGDAVFAVLLAPDGLSSLVKATTQGDVTAIRSGLDASPMFNTIAFSGDGATVFLALAGDGQPDPRVRHDPEAAHRDLDIYALDVPRNRLHVVHSEPGDDCCPFVAAGSLYWTHNAPTPEVVVLPIGGGDPRAVADHGFLPRWSPDGKQIAFTRAYYRLADYGLDMDGWRVDIDATGHASSSARPWIVGYGEDMGPAWSPDGRWVAFHSHRSRDPVPLYESPGRTDDTWLMPAGGGAEIRLTDFGFEVGPPDWAPDGRRILFDSWDRDGVPRFAKPWIITIDPATGHPAGAARMPLPPGVAGIGGEAWSPSGDDIAFIERIDDVKRALWVSRPDGQGARKLASFDSYTLGGVAWTPDGRRLLYSALADDRMQIFAIGIEGGTPVQITRGNANMMHPSVSPDGKLLAASRIAWRKELRRMKVP